MSNPIASRRLYRGAGDYVEKGKPFPGLSSAEHDRLVALGAISEAGRSSKAEPEHENKMEAAPANKSRSRKTKADK